MGMVIKAKFCFSKLNLKYHYSVMLQQQPRKTENLCLEGMSGHISSLGVHIADLHLFHGPGPCIEQAKNVAL